jgi:hypothetical protein
MSNTPKCPYCNARVIGPAKYLWEGPSVYQCHNCHNDLLLTVTASIPPKQENLFEVLSKMYSPEVAKATLTAMLELVGSRFLRTPNTPSLQAQLEAFARQYLASALPDVDMREFSAVITDDRQGGINLDFVRARKEEG